MGSDAEFTPPLAPPEIGRAAAVLARAFDDDPAMRYFAPDHARRRRLGRWLFGVGVRLGQLYGEVHTTPGAVDGVAVWLAPGRTTVTVGAALRAGLLAPPLFRLGPAGLARMATVAAHAEHAHRAALSAPHWYLVAVGVAPERQGHGLGGALLRPVLARADAAGLPCYLETVNEAALPFYRKRGFEVVGESRVPRGGPRFWAMVRAPRRGAPAATTHDSTVDG